MFARFSDFPEGLNDGVGGGTGWQGHDLGRLHFALKSEIPSSIKSP
jgi:hypothetical protein